MGDIVGRLSREFAAAPGRGSSSSIELTLSLTLLSTAAWYAPQAIGSTRALLERFSMSDRAETPDSHARRRPVMAAVLSGIFPGLGQLYNRERVKGWLFLFGGGVAAFGPFNPLDVDIDLNNPAVGLRKVLWASLPFLVIGLWSVVDAYRTAQHRDAGRTSG